ncbi:MAG TPA: hypothetical protein VKP11_12795, partial [Frankiaceae bacterium]|nr:hypothetical protein [Frankiaceae bacterium]
DLAGGDPAGGDRAGAGGAPASGRLGVRERNAGRWAPLLAIARAGVNSPLTSSAGRLFDAVAALLDVRDRVHYEGQAAVELEQRADPAEAGSYPVAVTPGTPARMRGADLVRGVLADLAAGTPVPTVAARFHNGVADAVLAVCRQVRAGTGLSTVALSGGVFQNVLLVTRTVAGLRGAGFEVLTHHRVPPNDGGVSLGQAVVAAARDRAGLVPGGPSAYGP